MKNKKDHVGEPIGIITPRSKQVDIALLECEFDRITNLEEKSLKSYYQRQVTLKRYLIIKSMLFPFHWLLLRTFMGKNDAKYLYSLQKEFFKVIKTEHVAPETLMKFSDYTI